MKGILLAGGSGSRLNPTTIGVSKHLIPIFDKPMIYYPLSVLMLAGIREILIISTSYDLQSYKRLLGCGKKFGITLHYEIQEKPEGIAQAFLIGEDFIGGGSVALILGDNIFFGQEFKTILMSAAQLSQGAQIFVYQVSEPSRFGVAELNESGQVVSLEEKPQKPKSNYAVTGLYFYDKNVIEIAKKTKPSARGELEITSINKEYLRQGQLSAGTLGRGFTWLDAGTSESLLDASQFISTIQHRQGFIVACLEEIAFNNGWVTIKSLIETFNSLGENEYKASLGRLIRSIEKAGLT
ncbi:glucose-1-phosphate thymidylyltransferase RfbA [Planktomarina temperata]|nr:glucose-1-phosphate thymidylyltransferase RfbA [Planktomarina temperata]